MGIGVVKPTELVKCIDCGQEYEIKKGDKPSDFQCNCGGELRYLASFNNNFNYKDFFGLFDIFNEESLSRLNNIYKKRDLKVSVTVGVLFSIFLSIVYGILSSVGFSSILHSFPIKYLPLFSAGILAAYVFKGNDLELFKTSAIAGIISAILNTIGNLFIIMLFNPQFFYNLSLPAIIIEIFIDGGILGVLGGLLIYLTKK